MRREALKYCYDILEACDRIQAFIQDDSLETYLINALLQSGVERQFMIVGEALFQALKVDPSIENAITDARRIISFRHVMVHDYATIKPDTIWGITQGRLPTLRREVEALLAQEAQPR